MSGERHPCDYCGTMLDEDDCVESDILAVNGPTLHSATQCREYVYACLVAYKRDAATFRQALHDAADALWLASQGAPLASAKEMAEQVRSAVAGERSAIDSVDGLMRSIDILGKEMAELRDTLGKVAALYNGFVNGEPRPDWAADQVLAAIGAALGPPWQDERPGGVVSPTAKPEPIGLQGEVCAATTTLRYLTRSTRLGELPGSATKALRCRLPFQHAGHHETLLPDVTGEDAGKVYLWPREPDWDRSAHMACDWCGADDPTTQRTLHADQWLCEECLTKTG